MHTGLGSPGAEISVLLSPSAFQHSIKKPTVELPRMATTSAALTVTTTTATVVPPSPSDSSSASTVGNEPHQTLCSKTQLQDTLINLIKNDPAFLSAIHDAYLQSLSKDFSNMKL
jgi:mRNA-decapping enzyme 1A